jgi:2-polyprenyl-3-methyl-5-hydroxy-6-metoxy-1,4-benzoquinol methylase
MLAAPDELCERPARSRQRVWVRVAGEAGAVGWHDSIATRFDDGYRRSPAFMEREAVWRKLIADHMPDDATVLDAGCGSGVFSIIAAERAAWVTGIDGSANMIAIAKAEANRRSLSNVQFEEAMLDQVGRFDAGSFDTILSSSVLEYVDRYEAVLASFARLLKPGGKLIVSMPNARALYRKAEAIAFALTGRPRYYAHVRNVVKPEALAVRLSQTGLSPLPPIYYGHPPKLAGTLASILPETLCKTLFATIAVKS